MIRDLKNVGVEELGLFWIGEPLLTKALPQYVAYAKEVGIPYVFVTTNGRLATLERIKPLFDAGLDSIKYSINAPDRETYKTVCGVDGFDDVIGNLKTAWEYRGKKSKPAIYASTVFDPHNPDPFNRVREMIGPYVDQHYPLRLYGQKRMDDEGVAIASTEERIPIESKLPCWALFTEPHISFDGHMSACYCDHDERLYMGDLKKMSLMEAWHSNAFTALRKSHLEKNVKGTPCETCIAYKI